MARYFLQSFSLVSVMCTAQPQSTRPGDNPGCVCTVNFPPRDCCQTAGPSADVQLLKNTVIALQESVVQMANDLGNLRRELKNSNTGPVTQPSSTGGAVFIRWGRKTCPGNGTELLYWGVAAGSHYTHSGGGSNYLCLHRDPEWGETTDGFQSNSYIYGAEFEVYASNDPFSKANARSLQNNNVPCAVCFVSNRPTKLMIPARQTCPDGWTKEYTGYLMGENHGHKGRSVYVCVDNAPEVIEGGRANHDGVLFYNTEAACGSLPCPNFVDGWEITCAVCSR